MFVLISLIGVYSYLIFLLGIFSVLTPQNIYLITGIYLLISFLLLKKYLKFTFPKPDKLSLIIFILLISQSFVNLIGALGPELSFDALWYHLTLPKLWLQYHSLKFFPGSVYQYSAMPMLTEMLYIPALVFQGAVLAKIIHFSFGILTLVVTYKLSKKLLPIPYCLLSCLILSSNLVFAWESTTAYVDLARTFFEVSALYFFLHNQINKSAASLGFAICTKIISFSSIPIYFVLSQIDKKPMRTFLSQLSISILIVLPWLIRAFLVTGNPIYPIFSINENAVFSFNPIYLWNLFTQASDPISPIYLITAPLVLLIKPWKQSRGLALVFYYCFLSLLVWFILPKSGGSRFFLPYLPAFSILVSYLISCITHLNIKNYLVILSLSLSLISISYRFIANSKYLPVISGIQSQSDFLTHHLDFFVGNYYDSQITKLIPPDKTVLVYGINNLYYANFRFIHEQFYQNQPVDFILVRKNQSSFIPDNKWQNIHENNLTSDRLFSLKNP